MKDTQMKTQTKFDMHSGGIKSDSIECSSQRIHESFSGEIMFFEVREFLIADGSNAVGDFPTLPLHNFYQFVHPMFFEVTG